MKKPHKHVDLIKAWADGIDVEYRFNDGVKGWSDWKTLAYDKPFLSDEWWEYRVKPENESIAANKTFDFHFRCHTNTTGKIVKVEVL